MPFSISLYHNLRFFSTYKFFSDKALKICIINSIYLPIGKFFANKALLKAIQTVKKNCFEQGT